MLLWLNSSLSMLLFFGRRVTTEGAWMQMKQPAWESMPVLDVRELDDKHLKMLSDTFEAVAQKELQPLAKLAEDEVRKRGAASGSWDVFEIKGTNSKKEGSEDRDHISDLTFQKHVLELAGVTVGRTYIVHLNKEYVRAGQIGELFKAALGRATDAN